MGNLPSIQLENEQTFDNDQEGAGQLQGQSDSGGDTPLSDYDLLFNTEELLKALVSMKETNESVIEQKKGDLEQWLKNHMKRGEASISDVEFIDYACNKGVPKEEAQKFFSELDPDQQGHLDIAFLIQMLKDRRGPSMGDSLLLTCTYLPGVVDTYLMEKPKSLPNDLGLEIVKFLRRYRVESINMSTTTISQLVSLLKSRERLVNGQYALVEEQQKEGMTEQGIDEEDQTRVTVTKCFSKIESSSNSSTVLNLTNSNADCYWQSNGSPRTHWIRIQMLPGVRLKELAIHVNSSDDSYMPKVVAISVGNSTDNLKQIKSINVARQHNGRVFLSGPLSTEYTYISINIRQCHSDGCDTKVRQLYIKGYRQKGKDVPTVLDGLIIWYLGLISSVSKAAMPIAPTLRGTLLSQSKLALCSLLPLSLSPTSPSRPEFLTPVILKEMESFIKSLCMPNDEVVTLDSESMCVWIGFTLSFGDTNTILECLLHLLDNVSLSLSFGDLTNQLSSIEQSKFSNHSQLLSLAFAKSDAKFEESNPVESIFATGTDTYFKTVKDVKLVNLIVKEEKGAVFIPISLNVKLPTSDKPRAMLVFGASEWEIDSEDFFTRFSKYDTFTKEDWLSLKTDTNAKQDQGVYEDGLFSYMEPNKETNEFSEMTLPKCSPIKYLLFKFIGSEGCDHVCVQSVRVRGHTLTPQQVEIRDILHRMDQLSPSSPNPSPPLEGGVVMVRVLVFLCRMLQDYGILMGDRNKTKRLTTTIQERHLCMEKFSLERIWNLYIPLTLSSTAPLLNDCSLLCLILLRVGVQFLKHQATPTGTLTDTPTGHTPSSEETSLSIAPAVLSHLCSLVDDTSSKPIIQSLARDIIKEGVVVFFPGTKARKKYLLDMVGVVLGGEQPSSWWLKFEALCSYFSQKDTNSLLELNWDITKCDDIKPEDTLNVLTTIVTVATKQVMVDLDSKPSQRQDDLVKLLCSMQSSLLFWCRHVLLATTDSKEGEEGERHSRIMKGTKDVLNQYVECIQTNCLSILNKVLQKIKNEEDIEVVLVTLERSIVGQTLRQLISFLGTFSSMEDLPFMSLLRTLQSLSVTIDTIVSTIPTIAHKPPELQCQKDEVIAVWTRESKHNYEDNVSINEDFVSPTATKFIVEFDSRCHTERRYDYLTFTDAANNKVQYDDNYGTDRWPAKGEFKGQKLSFHFHSDGSNNYWGYKFTVKAYGKSIPPLHWLYDLHVSLSRLLGQFVSSLISAQTSAVKASDSHIEKKKEEEALLKSNLWKTLFRGGVIVGKLTRSLSGAYEAVSPKDTALCSMLFEMAEGEEPSPLIEVCRAAKSLPTYGGPAIDKVIGAVFAALIWHSQEIREELSKMMGTTPKATPSILDAFTAAEALRRELVEARQKVIEAKEKEEDESVKSKMDEDEPLNSCHDKATFLLKFAGLTRVTPNPSRPGSPVPTRPSWGQKSSWRLQKSHSVVSTVGRIKQQISKETKILSPAEKHPSFETILSFVRNTGLTVANVETLLQERAELARKMSDGFSFAAEYLRVMSSVTTPPEIPILAFLQHLLVHQRKFPRHYAVRVDGCGLELENRLRKCFQMFVHRLIDLTKFNPKALESGEVEGSEGIEMVKNVFSHIMDMSWQDYDLTLLKNLQLPHYLFESVVGSSVTEKQVIVDKFEDEDAMMERYELFEKFMEKWETTSRFTEFLETDIAVENFKVANLFVVALARNPEKNKRVYVNCDGCSTRVEGAWFTDVDIEEDCDLCPSCFKSGTGNRPSAHTKDHVLLHLGGHLCDGCGISIMTHRFHRQSDKTDYCIGCFRKFRLDEELRFLHDLDHHGNCLINRGRSQSSTSPWKVYLLTKHPATEDSNSFVSNHEEYSKGMNYHNGILTELKAVSEGVLYNRQHNWLLFSSLTLTMATRLNQRERGTDPQYQRYACEVLLSCLELITQGLGFSLSAAKENEALKKKELELKKQKEEEDKLKKEEEERKKSEETDSKDKEDGRGEEKVEEPQSLEEPPVSPSPETVVTATDKEAESGTNKDASVEDTDSPHPSNVPNERKSSLFKQEAITDIANTNNGMSDSEKAFGLMYYESMLGLLASVLPKELSLLPWIATSGNVEQLLGDTVLPQLFRIARSDEMSSTQRVQAITVAIKYMSRVSPEVADHAIEVLEGVVSEGGGERKKTNGHKTVDYLFEMGAASLKNSDIPHVASVTDCLLLLAKNPEWKPTVNERIGASFSPSSKADLSMVFGLLLLAGFPEVAKVGSCVKWSKGATDNENHGIIVSQVTDTHANVINIKTRQNHSLKLSDIEIESSMDGCITESKLLEIIAIINRGIPQANKDCTNVVEQRWVLSLAIKGLGVLLKNSVKKRAIIESVLSEDLLPAIVKLACKPTHFNKQWKLSHLEILGISCYKPFEEKSIDTEGVGEDTDNAPVIGIEPVEDGETQDGDEQGGEGKSGANIGDKPSETGSDSKPDSDTKPDSDAKPDSDTKPDSDLKPDSDTKPDSDAKHDSDTKPDSDSKPDSDTKPDSDLKPDSDTKPDTSVSEQPTLEAASNEQEDSDKTDQGTVSFKTPKKEQSSSTPEKNKAQLEEQAALRGLTEDIQEMLKIMKDAFQCTIAQTRAMYENVGQDMDKFIISSDKYYDSATSGLKLPDDILEASKKWMPLQHSSSIRDTLEEYQEDQEDTGVTGFLTMIVDLKKMDARTESQSELKKSLELLPSSKESKKKLKELSEKEKSHQLLRSQLTELKTMPTDRGLMMKVYRAQIILNARDVLTSLLLHWPQEGPRLNCTLMGGLETSHWFSLLDFLVRTLTSEERNKVLKRVVACSEPDELISLGLTAAQCMKEVTVEKETKEFNYQKEKKTYTGKIVLPTAACMKVTMEIKQSLCGSVEIGANEDFTEHNWSGTGTGEKKREEKEWNVPGNVIHYKVVLDKMEKCDQKKVWTMRVSGLQKGRFETSYSLLHILLGPPTDTPTSEALLPVTKLWPNLIAAACELTGEQRIKVIGILLQLLQWSSSANKLQSVEGGASVAAGGSGGVQKLDLAMLKPLWSLYSTMSKEYDKGEKSFNLKPEILRALTELFLVVENTAIDWRMEQDLLVETITEDSLSKLLEKGISNVAYLSLGLGLSNQVSDAFIEAKRNYVPNPPPVPNTGGSHHSSSSSSSSSDTISSSSNSSGTTSPNSSSSSSVSDSFDENEDDDFY